MAAIRPGKDWQQDRHVTVVGIERLLAHICVDKKIDLPGSRARL